MQLVDSSRSKLRLLPFEGHKVLGMQARFPAVRELDLSRFHSQQPGELQQQLLRALAANPWPNIATLRLPVDLRVATATAMASACPCTSKLKVAGDTANQKSLAAVLRGAGRTLPQLGAVQIECFWPISDFPLEALANTCPGLRSLACHLGCGPRGVGALLSLASLRHLDVRTWGDKMERKVPGWMGGLARLTSLRSLRVGLEMCAAPGLADALAALTGLTRLHVWSLEPGCVLGGELVDVRVDHMQAHTLRALAAHCPKLRTLGCHSWGVEEDGQAATNALPQLPGVTEFLVVFVARGGSKVPVAGVLPNLKTVLHNHKQDVRDPALAGLQHLARALSFKEMGTTWMDFHA